MTPELMAVGDKMADAAQAVVDHQLIGHDDGYDATMHLLELKAAIKDWLKLRQGGDRR